MSITFLWFSGVAGAGVGGEFSAFDRASRKRCRHRKGGLPLFSRPLSARGDSDSDEEVIPPLNAAVG